MKTWRSIFFIIIFFVIGFLLVSNSQTSNVWKKGNESNYFKTSDIKYVKIAGVKLKVELALTSEAQEKGLSDRNKIEENEGMLFVFEKPSINNFWMKDMKFPIDIIWINKDKKVIYIEKNINPNTYPQAFGPNKESQYVLEINALFSEKNNLKENDSVVFLP
jgi:hypothetical protein